MPFKLHCYIPPLKILTALCRTGVPNLSALPYVAVKLKGHMDSVMKDGESEIISLY
jgi:hypothetical protein